MQVDIFGITEPNLDLSQPQVKFDILVKSLWVDRFLQLTFSASQYTTKSPTQKPPFKIGSTITGVCWGWSDHRVFSADWLFSSDALHHTFGINNCIDSM
jgi:hypothetical protein